MYWMSYFNKRCWLAKGLINPAERRSDSTFVTKEVDLEATAWREYGFHSHTDEFCHGFQVDDQI
jgi:hypothetical protein